MVDVKINVWDNIYSLRKILIKSGIFNTILLSFTSIILYRNGQSWLSFVIWAIITSNILMFYSYYKWIKGGLNVENLRKTK